MIEYIFVKKKPLEGLFKKLFFMDSENHLNLSNKVVYATIRAKP